MIREEKMAERTGLEPATPGVTGRYSNQLNYRSALGCHPLTCYSDTPVKSAPLWGNSSVTTRAHYIEPHRYVNGITEKS